MVTGRKEKVLMYCEGMSKSTKNVSTTVKTPKSGNSLEKYFGSPDSSKKRKMSSLDLSGTNGSPPSKRQDKDESTPSSEKVCKHLDTQLGDMEKRLEASLSATLSASITASVTAGLKDLIDTSLQKAMVTMSNRVNEVIEEHPVVVQHGEQIDSLKTENLILKSKMSKMEDESTHMKKKIASMESRALSNNLIIKGIPEEEWEKESTTRSKIYSELAKLIENEESDTQKLKKAKKLEMRNCKRLGRYVPNRARPISAEFVRKEDIEFILSKKTGLSKGVYADREYPAEIEKKRKILRPILTTAKHSTKYKKRCRMENDLLVIKGKRYGVHELEKLPKSLKPVNVTSKSNSTTFGYFGALNPLSNFYPAPFTHEGKKYHCSEQFIQSQKAKLFKDKGALKHIEQSTTGYQCKMEGQNISKTKQEEWSRKAKNLCLPGIHQKFVENAIPRDLLLKKTKGKQIVECCKDTVWGCGMPIHNDKCLDTLLWTNQGIMGEILEVVRSELGGTKLTSAYQRFPLLPVNRVK